MRAGYVLRQAAGPQDTFGKGTGRQAGRYGGRACAVRRAWFHGQPGHRRGMPEARDQSGAAGCAGDYRHLERSV